MKRLYLVPVDTYGGSRGPKYVGHGKPGQPVVVLPELAGLSWGAWYYGAEDSLILCADVTDDQHALLSSQGDVTYLCSADELDTQPPQGTLDAIISGCEGKGVPAHWVATGATHRAILRRIGGFFQLMQRCNGRGIGKLSLTATALATKWSGLPVAARNRITAAAGDFGFSTTFINSQTTIREILANFGQQYGTKPLKIGGVDI